MTFFLVQGGGKAKIFSILPIRWPENSFREGDLLREKSAYGYPPPSPPLAHVWPIPT